MNLVRQGIPSKRAGLSTSLSFPHRAVSHQSKYLVPQMKQMQTEYVCSQLALRVFQKGLHKDAGFSREFAFKHVHTTGILNASQMGTI